ncbi:hypothetical protein A3D54_03825 [Candidatus Falkowbacteria bacterium RIFCSPHIGHO2_02_FULL_45_15]|uniref:Uncharacterized protein n=1 Tax=Candidatus Falkowbacteria bacterium RIFCSPHIGHO2_02_FULL_45_15 TaxID=1797987 RepID=A0A1F5RJQ1_9BACT|nr:MAG: hypothetical protein A3D54_03825 [Candidatus Falkowbacteria bacterium RIFCSPHIGHO2_02_FULL_45_15]
MLAGNAKIKKSKLDFSLGRLSRIISCKRLLILFLKVAFLLTLVETTTTNRLILLSAGKIFTPKMLSKLLRPFLNTPSISLVLVILFIFFSIALAYFDNCRRPLLRRRLSTLRPFLVFIRRRKPCFLLRRRLLG